jgi:hypothetical protein
MKRIGNGLVMSLIGIGLAASSARWLVTPIDHLDASDQRTTAVMIQFVVGVAILAWGWRQDREERRSRGPEYQVFASGVVNLVIGAVLAGTALRTAMVGVQALAGIGLMMLSRRQLRVPEAVAA